MSSENAQRFGITIPPDLLEKFDNAIEEKMYESRSEAIRDLIRDFLVERDLEKEGKALGALTLVYDHSKTGVTERITDIQHHSEAEVVSTLHLHLDETNCMEILALEGNSSKIKKLSEQLKSLKGVKQGKLAITSVKNI
ncbi:MAG: nickel-responsive transcriptional regulator NikR [Candidatus Hadarchaeia archaeon]